MPLVSENLSLGPVADTESTQCVSIGLTNNDIAEPEETLQVELGAVTDEFVIIGEIDEASVIILDYSDCKSSYLEY